MKIYLIAGHLVGYTVDGFRFVSISSAKAMTRFARREEKRAPLDVIVLDNSDISDDELALDASAPAPPPPTPPSEAKQHGESMQLV